MVTTSTHNAVSLLSQTNEEEGEAPFNRSSEKKSLTASNPEFFEKINNADEKSILLDVQQSNIIFNSSSDPKQKFDERPPSVTLQVLLFLSCILFSGLQPFFYEAALWNEETQSKNPRFVPHSIFVGTFFLSILTGNVLSASLYGLDGLRSCWKLKTILFISPLAVCLSASETLDIYALKYISAPLKSTVTHVKLPVIALIRATCFKQYISAIATTPIVGATVAVFGYCYRVTGRVSQENANVLLGMTFMSANIGISTFGALWAETFLKKKTFRFPIQVSQLRMGALATSIVMYIVYCAQNELNPWFFFLGWNRYVVSLVIWSVIKDWVSTILVKKLDSLWRTLAGILAMCLTNFAAVAFRADTMEFVVFIFIMLLVIHVTAFALCKQEEHTRRLQESNK